MPLKISPSITVLADSPADMRRAAELLAGMPPATAFAGVRMALGLPVVTTLGYLIEDAMQPIDWWNSTIEARVSVLLAYAEDERECQQLEGAKHA